MADAQQPILRRLLTSISGTLTAMQEVVLEAGSNITLTTSRSGNRHTISIASTGGGGGGGAPTSSQYVTLATDATLTNERVLTAGHGVDLVDAGAGSTITVDVDETELDHSLIGAGMAWTSSGHTGTAGRLAGFSGAGAATTYQIGSDVQAYSATLASIAAGTWAGATSITTLGTVTTGTWSATAIGATKGGTGQTSYTTGDVLYASSSSALSRLAAGTEGQVLTMVSGSPAWRAALIVTIIGGRDIIVEARKVYDVPGCTTVGRP